MVLQVGGDGEAKDKAPKPERPKATREQISALRSEVRKCEERIAKLEEMRDKLAEKLADPDLYEDTRRGDLDVWNRKYAEVMQALDRAEDLWIKAQNALEVADKA